MRGELVNERPAPARHALFHRQPEGFSPTRPAADAIGLGAKAPTLLD